MNIRIVTASAGSGKTTRLSEVLDGAIASGEARPDGIVAMTFTRDAATELIERARSRLLSGGRAREAQELLTARVGTVNAVCGALVAEFAFELGLSPALRVLDEDSAELEQKRALAGVVSAEVADELQRFQLRFDKDLDFRLEVRAIIEAARANGLGPADLRASAERSIETLEACLGPAERDGAAIDQALAAALERALGAIDTRVDATGVTGKYVDRLRAAKASHGRGWLRWGDWANLTTNRPGKKSAAAAAGVVAAAGRHLRHPRLRDDLRRLITLLFQVAADGLAAYQEHKRQRGVLDFMDQEAHALRALRDPQVRSALEGQLDLVLIDELQDTSPLQLAIFVELAGLARESVWVGDQKQAIYGFRGTDPALMDAVIESLTATSTDPELLREAVEAVGRRGRVETLATSYRSRPALVSLTNELFARAFAARGIPEERTRLRPASGTEPRGLGAVVEHWPLAERSNQEELAGAVAAGVRDLLAGAPLVRERGASVTRAAGRRDVAVLCRTNAQCQRVADALAALDVPAIVPRMGLLDTAEGQLAVAGLKLWVDPSDALAAANLARLVTHAADLDGLVQRALAAPGSAAFVDDPIVAAILAARAARPDLGPIDAMDAVIDAAGLRALCASWTMGGTSVAQRLANLDALRAHAVAYAAEAAARREAATVVGLLRHLAELCDDWGFAASRTDRQALLGADDAVTVSTWHRAKGREWPLTVLFGLESMREPVAYGLHIESDAPRFELAQPLAGRWLRYWPNPYTTGNQGGPVRDAMEASPLFARVVDRWQREALRLLYVGWTRARDRVILAAAEGKLLRGILGTLAAIDPTLVTEPAGDTAGERAVVWAGQKLRVPVRPASAAAPVARAVEVGELTVGRAVRSHAPARRLPSMAPPVPCTIAAPVEIGPRLPLPLAADMAAVGSAVHGFLAADRAEREDAARRRLAARLLRGHGVDDVLDADALVGMGTRLWSWMTQTFTPAAVHREWPITERLATGTLVGGTVDLVVRTAGGTVVLDHKTFPGTVAEALARLPAYSGQLAAYAHAVATATGVPVVSTWIHLPVLGVVVEVNLARGMEVEP
jgi:ATP-dependent helicase/nuclease subunit A